MTKAINAIRFILLTVFVKVVDGVKKLWRKS
jgi:hypothetical protein